MIKKTPSFHHFNQEEISLPFLIIALLVEKPRERKTGEGERKKVKGEEDQHGTDYLDDYPEDTDSDDVKYPDYMALNETEYWEYMEHLEQMGQNGTGHDYRARPCFGLY